MSFACSLDWTGEPPAWRGPGRPAWSLLSYLAIRELADDVEVADVAGVLLDQVEQDPLKCRRPGFVPCVARVADVGKVMGFHDGPAARRLSVQRRHKLLERLVSARDSRRRSYRGTPAPG